MFSTKLLPLLGLLLSSAGAAPASSAPCADYGTWAVQVTTGNAASGYRWGDLYAEHSSRPGVVSHSYWLYNPVFQNITFRPDDPTLRNTYIDGLGVHDLEIWQTVPLDGVDTRLKGVGTIEMILSETGMGRGTEGNTTIAAELDVGGA